MEAGAGIPARSDRDTVGGDDFWLAMAGWMVRLAAARPKQSPAGGGQFISAWWTGPDGPVRINTDTGPQQENRRWRNRAACSLRWWFVC